MQPAARRQATAVAPSVGRRRGRLARARRDGAQEATDVLRALVDGAAHDLGGEHAALRIEGAVGLVVHRQRGAVERDAGEEAAIARIGKHFGIDARGGFARAAHRTRGDRRAGAERELAVGDAFDAALAREHQHDVGGLRADLPADAAAGEVDEHRVREAALAVAHDHDARAATTADDEGDLRDVGDDRDAIGALQETLGDHLVALLAQLIEHFGRHEQPRFFTCLGADLGERKRGDQQQRQDEETAEFRQHAKDPVAGRHRPRIARVYSRQAGPVER